MATGIPGTAPIPPTELFVVVVRLVGETDLSGLGPVTELVIAQRIGQWVQAEGKGRVLGVLPVRRFADLAVIT